MTSVLVTAQNKYTDKDLASFKQGMLDGAREMSKSVPIQTSENLTLTAIGVTNELITYKYKVAGWDSRFMLPKDEIAQSKSQMSINIFRCQKFPQAFLECLKTTKLEYQIMFFANDGNYIGGFRLSYVDFVNMK